MKKRLILVLLVILLATGMMGCRKKNLEQENTESVSVTGAIEIVTDQVNERNEEEIPITEKKDNAEIATDETTGLTANKNQKNVPKETNPTTSIEQPNETVAYLDEENLGEW